MGCGVCCQVVCTWLVQLLVQFPPPVQWVCGCGWGVVWFGLVLVHGGGSWVRLLGFACFLLSLAAASAAVWGLPICSHSK